MPLHTRSPSVRPQKPGEADGQQRRAVVPCQRRAAAAGRAVPTREGFLFSFVQESGQSSEVVTRGSATGGATQRQVPSDLRLCPGWLLSSPCPSSPGCPLTHRGMPAARCPLLQLEQSSSARQRFPLAAALPMSCQRRQPQRFHAK